MVEAALIGVGKGIAIDATKAVAQLVASQAFDEIKLFWGFKDQVQRLKNKLEYIQAFLNDVENAKEEKGQLVTLWLNKVKDAAYLADDVMDDYAYEIIRRKLELENQPLKKKFRNFITFSSNPVVFRFRMAHKVSNIVSLFDELDIEAQKIGLKQAKIARGASQTIYASHNTEDAILSQVRRNPTTNDTGFIGREGDVKTLMEKLGNPNIQGRGLPIVAIVGMGGLGKTTFARHLYEKKVGGLFHCKLWICVSENFDINRILKEMAEYLTADKCKLDNPEAIVSLLQKKLKGEKTVFFLDDVWNEHQELWGSLKELLQRIEVAAGSMVIITTRSNEVAMKAGAAYTHMLKGLSEGESWLLFKQKVYGNEIGISSLESVGRRVVEKCKGVPLSIKVVGGLLQSLRHSKEWESIEESKLWELPHDQSHILPSLLLSYNHLPSPSIKQCFAYCAIFPKDSGLDMNELIGAWSAQGFLTETKKSTMEEIGETYIKVLLSSSLLSQERDRHRECFKMHDLVHDLALYVSADELFHVADDQSEVHDCRHLIIACKTMKSFAKLPNEEKALKKLRTISLIRSVVVQWDILILAKHVRTLILKACGIKEISPAIESLTHLRYLDLSYNDIATLPESFSKLYQLQTLRLEGCDFMRRLPIVLYGLVNLRHIFTRSPLLASRGLSLLVHLRTLPFLAFDEDKEGWSIDELGSLDQLRGPLVIAGLVLVKSKEKAREAALNRLDKVTLLTLDWSAKIKRGNEKVVEEEGNGAEKGDGESINVGGKDGEEMGECRDNEDILEELQPHPNITTFKLFNYSGARFSSWILQMAVISKGPGGHQKLLSNLTNLTLVNCRRCRTIPAVGQLPFLRSLILQGLGVKCIGNEFYLPTNDGSSVKDDLHLVAFPSLETLDILDCPSLTSWMPPPSSRVATAFPCLAFLRVMNCRMLQTLPALEFQSLIGLRLANLDSIRSLDIIKCATTVTSLNSSRVTTLPLKLPNRPKLKALEIVGLRNLISWPVGLQSIVSIKKLQVMGCYELASLPDDLFGGFSSLCEITLQDCSKITRLPTSLQQCSSLVKVIISMCPLMEPPAISPNSDIWPALTELDLIGCRGRFVKSMLEGVPNLEELRVGQFKGDEEQREVFCESSPLHRLISLKNLILRGGDGVNCLPEQLQLLTGLSTLSIECYDKLEELPDWVFNLTSLEGLGVLCKRLKCLPSKQTFLRLTRLKRLIVKGDSILEEKYSKENGPEWHNVSHIPFSIIGIYDVARYFTMP